MSWDLGSWQQWTSEIAHTAGSWLTVAAPPFWEFMNSNFVSGLIPAIVGVLLAKRVAEVAETNKSAEALRSAEAQIQELDRHEDAAEIAGAVELAAEAAASTPDHVVPISSTISTSAADQPLSQEEVDELDAKISRIKKEIERRITLLDGRVRRKYKDVARYDHRPIIMMLLRDGMLTDAAAWELVDILNIWRSYRLKKPLLPRDKARRLRTFKFPRVPRKRNSSQVAGTSGISPEDVDDMPETGATMQPAG